jgi:meso-butanediol dehydrogenase / (S,S)-butanediol dehydrogenase / diacetyl reductase
MLITGAGSGIGAAVAERAAADGWQVTICGRRPGPLAEVAERTGARPVAADITDPAAVQALVDGTVAEQGRLDCVVANAGVMRGGSVADLDPADWELTLRTNLTAPYLLARAAPGWSAAGTSTARACAPTSTAAWPRTARPTRWPGTCTTWWPTSPG